MAKKIRAWLYAVLCIVLYAVPCTGLTLIARYERTTEQAAEEISREMDIERRPLSLQVYNLEQEIYDAEGEVLSAQTGVATTQFLVTDLSAQSYQQVILPMAEYDYPVGLGVSLAALPGAEECLTADEALALAAQGWYFCYVYSAEEAASLLDASADGLTDAQAAEALGLWLAAVDEAMSAQGLAMGTAVYFPSGTFRDGFAAVLQAQGIEVVIHHGELGTGLLTASEEDGLWYVGAAWWRNNEVLANKLATISQGGGELVTLMGVDSSAADTTDGWMSRFKSAISGKRIKVTDLSDMAEIQTSNASLITGDTALEAQARLDELEAQVAALKAQIDEIQDQYREQIRSLEQ